MSKVVASNEEGMTLTVSRRKSPKWDRFYDHCDAMPASIAKLYEEHNKRLYSGILVIRSERLKKLNEAQNSENSQAWLKINSHAVRDERAQSLILRERLIELAPQELKDYFKDYDMRNWVGV